MMRLNLSSDDVKSCKETTAFVKQGILFKKSKEPDQFRASKTRKSIRKVSKTRSVNEF